jgi:hypothetical protein
MALTLKTQLFQIVAVVFELIDRITNRVAIVPFIDIRQDCLLYSGKYGRCRKLCIDFVGIQIKLSLKEL